MNNGYIYIATIYPKFYNMAVQSAESLRYYYPDAKICLFTEKQFVDERSNVFDIVNTDTPRNSRSKMWGMANSPFDTTFYMDCDTYIESEEIKNVFDELNNNDMMFTKIHDWDINIFEPSGLPNNEPYEIHGGVCLYKSTAKEFMKKWFELYNGQVSKEWLPLDENGNLYSDSTRMWDQFTLWWLLTKNNNPYKYLKWDFFKSLKWNYIALFDALPYDILKGENPVVIHYTVRQDI